MSKTIITAKANSVLLATVLVSGIIALSYPSFMIGAQAQEFNGMDQRYNNYEPEHETDYGMDSYDKKSYEKDYSYDKSKDSVKNIECKNYNFNGLKPHGMSSGLNGLSSEALAADEGANGASSSESDRGSYGGSSGHDGSVTVYCIFDNHKKIPKPPVPPVKDCEECFETLSMGPNGDFAKVEAELTDEAGFTFSLGGPPVSFTANSFEELCQILEENARNFGDIQSTIVALFRDAGVSESLANDISDCIATAIGIRD